MAKIDYDAIVHKAVQALVTTVCGLPQGRRFQGSQLRDLQGLGAHHKQSPEIAEGVHVGESETDVGPSDQGSCLVEPLMN